MSIRFAQIVRLDDRNHPTVRQARRVHRFAGIPATRTRRQFLRDAGVTATVLGLISLSRVPTARRAWASHPEDDMAPTSGAQLCGDLGSWVDDDDCQGCHRTTCGGCCNPDSHWHRHGGDSGFALRPNHCDGPNGTGNWDGWKWKATACCPNGRRDQVWRCHDGWRLNGSGSADDERTVCKFRTNDGSAC
jgi:hypothetical protein